MFQPLQVANFFIKSSLRTGEEVTPMKLIKLTYIAHGWHLGMYNTELIDEAVCAWKYGPVIESIYHNFKGYGNCQITEFYRNEYGQIQIANGQIEPFLQKVWDEYKDYSGVELSAMTHQKGTPWDIVWNQRGGKNLPNVIIPNNIIAEHYKQKINSMNGKPSTQFSTN
jgi:uncharacterized phage-associated protein